MKKREWIYIQQPQVYEITCDICGGINLEWSEFENMVWCYVCGTDNKGRGGIFSGPIPINLLGLLGLSLDRIHIKSGKRMKMLNMENRIEYMLCVY